MKVLLNGDAHTPSRFWVYALETKKKLSVFFNSKDFIYSKKDTDVYKKLNKAEKKKIQFTWINGIKQI